MTKYERSARRLDCVRTWVVYISESGRCVRMHKIKIYTYLRKLKLSFCMWTVACGMSHLQLPLFFCKERSCIISIQQIVYPHGERVIWKNGSVNLGLRWLPYLEWVTLNVYPLTWVVPFTVFKLLALTFRSNFANYAIYLSVSIVPSYILFNLMNCIW